MLTLKQIRAESCGAYHREVKHCEVWSYLCGQDWEQFRKHWHLSDSMQVHHIFGRGGPEHEHRTNLIMVSACAHAWGHDRCPTEFRIACLYAKWQGHVVSEWLAGLENRSVSNPEVWRDRGFDAEAMSKIIGVPFADWLDVQGATLTGTYKQYTEEIKQWVSKNVVHQQLG